MSWKIRGGTLETTSKALFLGRGLFIFSSSSRSQLTRRNKKCQTLIFKALKQLYYTQVKQLIQPQDHVLFPFIKQRHMNLKTRNMLKIYLAYKNRVTFIQDLVILLWLFLKKGLQHLKIVQQQSRHLPVWLPLR